MNERCIAHSSQSGERCKRWPVRGAAVCATHGGRAPQVKARATERIAALVDPAISRLAELLADPMPAIAMAAVKDILDRAGYSPRQRVELDIHARAEVLARELGLDPDALVAEAQRIITRSH